MAAVQKVLFAAVLLCCAFSFVVCQEAAAAANNATDSDVTEGRTFGHHFLKRISFALIPGAFVIGVVTTLLAALTVVSIKGLGVGVILLILSIGQLMSRAFPVAQATAYTAPHPVPVVYSHTHAQQPVWLEKEWK